MLLEGAEPKNERKSSALVSFSWDPYFYLCLVEDLPSHHFVSLMLLYSPKFLMLIT